MLDLYKPLVLWHALPKYLFIKICVVPNALCWRIKLDVIGPLLVRLHRGILLMLRFHGHA
jgi:hypothetical protein